MGHRVSLAAVLLAGISACSGLGIAVLPTLLGYAANLLRVASDNYPDDYVQELRTLLAAFAAAENASDSAAVPVACEGLTLDVALLAQGEDGAPIMLQDGAILRDGRGDAGAGHRVKMWFRTNRRCHVYVVAIDATGWAVPVFPNPATGNAQVVAAGQGYTLPAGSAWYALDQHRGIENVYFVASERPRPDLDAVLASMANRVAALGSQRRLDRPDLAVVSEPAIATRGITARLAQPTWIETSPGEGLEVTPASFLARIAGADVVVTRWFDHR